MASSCSMGLKFLYPQPERTPLKLVQEKKTFQSQVSLWFVFTQLTVAMVGTIYII